MRYFYLLLITFIFVSCGNQKMHFVRNNTTKQKVVEIAEIPLLKKKSETAFVSKEKSEKLQPETEYVITNESDSDQSTEVTLIENVNTRQFPRAVEDSTTISAQEVDAITEEALLAERDGTYSLLFSILFYVLAIASFIILVITIFGDISTLGAIGAIIVAILALISLILGFVFGIKSLRAQFTTPKGKRRAISGVVLSGLALLLMLFNVVMSFF